MLCKSTKNNFSTKSCLFINIRIKKAINPQNTNFMKDNKPENQKKESRKAVKKALEQSLTTKLFEAVKSLGHDAEKIGEDLMLVSKFVAKKISKKVKSDKKEVQTKVQNTLEEGKTKVAKVKAAATNAEKTATPKAKPRTNGVKVDVTAFTETKEDKLKVEPPKSKSSKPVLKTNKPAKSAVKKSKAASGKDKEQPN
jgi:hypothetical protein